MLDPRTRNPDRTDPTHPAEAAGAGTGADVDSTANDRARGGTMKNSGRIHQRGARALLVLAITLIVACSSTKDNGVSSVADVIGQGDGSVSLFDTSLDDGTGVGGTDQDGLGDDGAADGNSGDAGEADTAGADTGAADTGAADTGTADTGAADTSTGPVDDFGKPCKADADCKSGYCVEGYNGYVCTQTCGGGATCPKGHACTKVDVGAKEAVFLCLAQVSKICHPCATDLDCSGGRCVQQGSESFCAPVCGDGTSGACPTSHACVETVAKSGAAAEQLCMPKSGSCNCSATTVGVVRACQQNAGPLTCYGVEICQAAGWSGCQLADEVCDGKDNNCDGTIDEGFVDANGGYTTTKACGACGNDCSFTSYPNATSICALDGGFAACAMKCDPNTFDVDDNPKTGCECVFASATDLPDGPDQNCDGIDGEVSNGIFVAKNGKDSNSGTIEAPVASIQAGIALAKSAGKRDVYVATGVYDESIALQQGVSVYGGYSADFHIHDVNAYDTVVVAADPTAALPAAVYGVDIGNGGAPTIVDGLTVYAASVKGESQSTYGLLLRDCGEGLQIRHTKIIAGDAGNGSSGDAGTNGGPGAPGTAGKDAKDLTSKSTCNPATDQTVGGNGGSTKCGSADTSGGKGGTAICPAYVTPAGSPQTAENGTAGSGSGGGAGGIAGLDGTIGKTGSCTVCTPPKDSKGNFLGSIGLAGGDGSNGSTGAAGKGASPEDGAIASGLWVAPKPSNGVAGGPGGGGGGGGAGGGVDVTTGCTSGNTAAGFRYPDVGGSGGGGGSGGCGGSGGKAGTSGGASFAAFLVYTAAAKSVPVLADNLLVTGNGGEGGQGGQGGVGGLGGDGKPGGGDDPTKLAWCAGSGGRGGQGGNGGHGGGGGGGAGGPSWAIFVSGASGAAVANLKANNQTTVLGLPGKGGQGGKSLGKTGSDGLPGNGGAANF